MAVTRVRVAVPAERHLRQFFADVCDGGPIGENCADWFPLRWKGWQTAMRADNGHNEVCPGTRRIRLRAGHRALTLVQHTPKTVHGWMRCELAI
jgi:hypothetical protein